MPVADRERTLGVQYRFVEVGPAAPAMAEGLGASATGPLLRLRLGTSVYVILVRHLVRYVSLFHPP